MFKKIEIHQIVEIRPVSHRNINRGNGRRMTASKRAKVPESVWSDATCATHEVEYKGNTSGESTLRTSEQHWGSAGNGMLPGDLITQADMSSKDRVALFHLQKALYGRQPRSKILVHQDVAYFVMTWTDFFGASIKESELGYRAGGNRVVFLQRTDLLAPVPEVCDGE